MKSESSKKYALIAAICFAVYVLRNIIKAVTLTIQNPGYLSYLGIQIWIYWGGMLGMAAALFLRNKKIVIGASGVLALRYAYFTFMNSFLLEFFEYAIIVVLIILSLKESAVPKKIWFVPAALLLVGSVEHWITYGYFSLLSEAGKDMLLKTIEIAALFFTGLWLRGDPAPAKAAPTNEYASFDPQALHSAPVSSPAIGGADKLKMYKELLDSGTITQEEFDVKKKQILGL